MKGGRPRYHIAFTKSARKEFLDVPTRIQDKILEALTLLALNPYSELLQIKKLKGPEKLLRVRIGDYRVLYRVDSGELVVVVIKVGHRKEVYRR